MAQCLIVEHDHQTGAVRPIPGALPPRPGVPPPSPWRFPDPQRWSLPNGPTVQAFHLPGQHVVAVRVGIPTPLSGEPAGLAGIGLIMARCLDEGTTRHTSEELAELLERRGIALGAGVGERGLFVDLDVAGAHLQVGLELLTECLTQASFPEQEVARQVRNRQAEIAHEHADAASRATLEFLATYYPPGVRAALPTGGTAGTIAALDAGQVRSYHRAVVRPDQAQVVVAGDLTGLDLPELLEATVGQWPTHPAPVGERADDEARSGDAERVVFVDRPGSVQTEIYLGRPGPDRRDPHGWGAYQVLSFLTGGSPQSRLDKVLREERGYTYGISAGFRPRSRGGLFIAAGAVRSDVTAEALRTMLAALGFTGADLGEQEVRRAADFVARTAPGRYATADMVAAEAMGLAMDGLDGSFVTRMLEQVTGLTRDQAAAAWDAHRHPGWTVVLVGDAAEHAAGVEALGVGLLQVVQRSRPSQRPMPAET